MARSYQPDTLVLETDFETSRGAVKLLDFMPIQDGSSKLVRIVRGVRGTVHVRSDLKLRFDYGSIPPSVTIEPGRAIAIVGPDLVVLHSPTQLKHSSDAIIAEAELCEDDEIIFTLSYGSSVAPCPEPIDAQKALAATQRYWHDWIGQYDKKTDWPEAVRRSLITLKALICGETGAIVAAPTTSLPEKSRRRDELGL